MRSLPLVEGPSQTVADLMQPSISEAVQQLVVEVVTGMVISLARSQEKVYRQEWAQ